MYNIYKQPKFLSELLHRIIFRIWRICLFQTSATCQHGTRGVNG